MPTTLMRAIPLVTASHRPGWFVRFRRNFIGFARSVAHPIAETCHRKPGTDAGLRQPQILWHFVPMTWSVLTWNVLFGGEDRVGAILEVLRRERPDVVVLQECLGWETGDRLAQVGEAIGARHTVLGNSRPRGSGKRYHVAIASRIPVTATKTHADPAAIGHCILEAQLAAPGGAVTLLGTHFDSHGEDERLRDARTANAIAPASRLVSERVVLAGDLNALSRRDPYPVDLDRLLLAAGTEKYGHPPRFDTIDLLEANGWLDQRPDPWVTAVRNRGGVRIEYRTDYVFASPVLAPSCTGVRVVASNGASDHEPVLATFR